MVNRNNCHSNILLEVIVSRPNSYPISFKCFPQVYVTTKLWRSEWGKQRAAAAIKTSLEKMGLDYVGPDWGI